MIDYIIMRRFLRTPGPSPHAPGDRELLVCGGGTEGSSYWEGINKKQLVTDVASSQP